MNNIDIARKNLISLLDDLAALKPHVDIGNDDAQDFVAAFTAAREKAKEAARTYTEALSS
jgi:hypothetical protein